MLIWKKSWSIVRTLLLAIIGWLQELEQLIGEVVELLFCFEPDPGLIERLSRLCHRWRLQS